MSIGCFGWTVSDGFRCSEQAEVIARLPKAAVRSLLRRVKRCRASDTEVGVGGEKTAGKALEEYRQTLQLTFGSSETINDIMRDLEWWIGGL